MTDRKTEILDQAEELLLVKGFCGFSYADLSARLGITKASIHHHFASKEELGIALCDRFEGMFRDLTGTVAAAGGGPRQILEGMLEHAAGLAEAGDRCCPGGVLQAEYESLPAGLQRRVDELFAGMHAALARVLDEGRRIGQLTFDGAPEDQAWLVISIQQGAVLSARVHGAQVFHAVARQLEASLFA